MNVYLLLSFLAAGIVGSFLQADVIELKNGERIEGRILSENDDSLEIQVGQNDAGTIRRVLIIHSSEIASWMADQEGRVSRNKGVEVDRLTGKAYIERLLKEAEAQIDEGNYDQGIQQFGEAADLATAKMEGLEPAERAEALNIREHALRLQLAALEGKSEFLEQRTDGVQDEMEEYEKELKRDIDQFKKDKEDYEDSVERGSVQLGQRHKKTDIVKREEELLKRQRYFNEQKVKVAAALKAYEEEMVKTETQIKLVEERVEQSEEDARAAERGLRGR